MTPSQELQKSRQIAERLRPGVRLFFIGIGGISMSGLAELMISAGAVVAGSDANANQRVAYLKENGVSVFVGHDAAHIDTFRPDLVVMTRAIFADNPERLRAQELGIPTVERAVLLGALTALYPQVVNIAGTNGKSTATAMASLMLMDSGCDPTVHLGAELKDFKTTVHVGGPDLFVSEACEFGRGFFHYRSTVALVMNIVHDHIDCYKTLEDMIEAFATFALNLEEGSTLVLPCGEDNVEAMLERAERRRPGFIQSVQLLTYGKEGEHLFGRAPDFQYSNLHYEDGYPRFRLTHKGRFYADLALAVPGEFNVRNAVAAVAVAATSGATAEAVARVLARFRGAEGRFTYTGRYNGARVFADYAHHHSAIEVTVEAARHFPEERLFFCFQPLTHSRVRGFFQGFVNALKDVQPLFISEIYDDRERDDTISSLDLVQAINEAGGKALYFATNDELEAHIRPLLGPGDLLLIMGVDLREVADRLTGRQNHIDPVTS